MKELYEVRKEYGGIFLTVFDDGLLIPWKPLTLGDYIKYSRDRQRGLIPAAQLEDEIFSKCVQDDSIVRQMDFLKAGIISTVVINIWQYSGPTGISEFNDDLEGARQIMMAPDSCALHDLVQIITIAFPYKPEEVYDMDYETFLFRLAQSEKKLLQLGIYLKEPISLISEDKQKKKSKLGRIEQPVSQNKKPNIDAKKLWDEQQKARNDNKPVNPIIDTPRVTDDKWWKTSPVLEAPNSHNIDFNTESAEQHTFGLTGHEKADSHIERDRMTKDAQWIYADLLKELAKRKKR